MTKISAKQRKNLNKLADYLLALPEDYQHFGMEGFCSTDEQCIDPHVKEAKKFPCGTVACAVGHAITAGVKNTAKYTTWWSYSDDYLLDSNSAEWDWCFEGSWSYTDDTPQGAGKRIKYLLENGLPKDASHQRNGDAPLIYLKEV